MKALSLLAVLVVLFAVGCSFSEYSQTVDLEENIDDHRTGCEVDADKLLAEYKRYEANEYYYPGFSATPEPTPTVSPVSDTELTTKIMLERVWENGCQTGRRDAVGAEQTTLMSLRDQMALFEERIAALEPTPVPTPPASTQ